MYPCDKHRVDRLQSKLSWQYTSATSWKRRYVIQIALLIRWHNPINDRTPIGLGALARPQRERVTYRYKHTLELELLFYATSNAPPAPIRIYVCDMLVEIGFSTKNIYDSRANSHHVPPITIGKWLPRKHN